MAHGTGYYWNRIFDLDIQTDEYAVLFTRLCYYYYPQMSDSYRTSCDVMDEYEVTVMKWRTDSYGHKVADHVSDSTRSGSISKEEAKKIYWNIKNRKISFDTCRRYFKKLAGRELTA